ncbi:hypothetical protein QWS64_002861 [Escherichia coli]|uniref:hypothetical protein n=1 Tax=Enterobacteriaceae TaxID=543 RepID=UPI0006275FF9|nr:MULTISPECIES: hypothetical protein [Enterobacteriaceae]ELP1261509.1 hypothetical protein [Escherichia coli]KKJ90713.1 hypothetical protein TR64_03690 [Citrobacter freundii]MCG9437084.1 hypothetical protein [Escherichia coli]
MIFNKKYRLISEQLMPLFKYIKKEHLDAFFSRGSLKIGSLYEYRKVEQYGTAIGDNKEGVYETVLDRTGGYQIDLSEDTPEANFFKARFDIKGPGIKIVMGNGAKIISSDHSPDVYIFCVTTEFNLDAMRAFGCDSCIEITRPELFFNAISKTIRHKASFEGGHPVTYGDKTTSYMRPHPVHPALMKSEEYSYQKEYRGIWTPNKQINSPLYINAPRAIRACRVYKF